MIDEHSVSRRASLKQLGVMGAAMVLGGAASVQTPVDQKPADQKPAPTEQTKLSSNVVDVAVGRMANGYS